MPDTLRFRNFAAIALLVMGKLLGIVGLAVGAGSRVLGGTLLVLAGLFIVGVVVLCVGSMKERVKEENGQKQALRQMMKEGTLKQFMRDIEAEKAARAAETETPDEGEDEAAPAGQRAFS